MKVELALFDGEELLQRTMIRIGPDRITDRFNIFTAHHQLGDESAEVVIDGFAEPIALKSTVLDIPIHESEDWESIDLGGYTLAFWCRIDS